MDTIDHNILLSRIQNPFGIHDTPLECLKSYLSNHTPKVLVSGFFPPAAPLNYDVPQGSALGPVLFALYTRPVSGVIDHRSLSIRMKALQTILDSSGADIKESKPAGAGHKRFTIMYLYSI